MKSTSSPLPVRRNRWLELAPEPPFATATDAPDVDGLFADGPVTVYRDDDCNLSGTVIFLPFRRRERAMLRFRRMGSLQKFVAVHANLYNHFDTYTADGSIPASPRRLV